MFNNVYSDILILKIILKILFILFIIINIYKTILLNIKKIKVALSLK